MWKVFGFDTFDEHRYPIQPLHEFEIEADARAAVRTELEKISNEQHAGPDEDPDDDATLQDMVLLVHPDGFEEVFNTNNLKF